MTQNKSHVTSIYPAARKIELIVIKHSYNEIYKIEKYN